MKAQLVVVQGKPEGKVIPLVGPNFKIGRGESCHLRPNSERVSREHAEFLMNPDSLAVRDLGSRNGTLVNGKAVPLGAICKLNDRDLVQVGPLTFAVAILSEAAVVVAQAPSAPSAPAKPRTSSPDDVSTDDIDSWLVGAGGGSTADLPTNLYKGETQTISAFKGKPKAEPAVAPIPTPAPAQPSVVKTQAVELEEEVEEVEEEAEVEEIEAETKDEIYDRFDSDDEEGEDEESPAEIEELIDESNPFYAAKKAQVAAPAKKAASQDTSDVAHDILRKLMQQRKAARS